MTTTAPAQATNTAASAVMVPLTRAQRDALQKAATRRSRRLRRQLVVAHRSGSLPEAEERELFGRARAAAAVAELASDAEAIIIRSDRRWRQPETAADVIVHEALALAAAVAAQDGDDVAATLNTLSRLIDQAQQQPNLTGYLTWPKHTRRTAATHEVTSDAHDD